MAIGKTPVNQLNALPLQDADSNAAGGILQTAFGTVERYFSPAVLLINGITAWTTDGLGNNFLATPFLDLRGCSTFAFQFRCVLSAGRVALPAMLLFSNYRLSSSDVQPPFGSNGDTTNAPLNQIIPGARAFAAGNNGDTQTIQWMWAPTSSGGTNPTVTIGSDIRFIIQVNGAVPPASNAFSAALWGSSQ